MYLITISGEISVEVFVCIPVENLESLSRRIAEEGNL